MPDRFPITSAASTPMATESLKVRLMPSQPPSATPAAKKAKTGTANPAGEGRNRCSKLLGQPGAGVGRRALLRSTGTAKPSSTPATVACTPEACISTQVAMPSGSRMTQAAGWC